MVQLHAVSLNAASAELRLIILPDAALLDEPIKSLSFVYLVVWF